MCCVWGWVLTLGFASPQLLEMSLWKRENAHDFFSGRRQAELGPPWLCKPEPPPPQMLSLQWVECAGEQ